VGPKNRHTSFGKQSHFSNERRGRYFDAKADRLVFFLAIVVFSLMSARIRLLGLIKATWSAVPTSAIDRSGTSVDCWHSSTALPSCSGRWVTASNYLRNSELFAVLAFFALLALQVFTILLLRLPSQGPGWPGSW
jgi:hypothetical protein